MPTTPNRGYPYQTLADPPDGPNLGEDGFLAVDSDMATQIARIAVLEARVHHTRIAESILSGTTATITFSSIPATYRSLQLVIMARGSDAATFTAGRLQFNADASAVYDSQQVTANAATVAGAESINQTSMQIGDMSAASAPAGAAGIAVINIPYYNNTTFWKEVTSSNLLSTAAGAGGLHSKHWASRWRNTAAVTSITLLLTTGSYVAGSSFALYGLP